MTSFCAISDTHGMHYDLPELPEADVIFHAGDCTGRGRPEEIQDFVSWYGSLDYEHKILVPGNHDWGFQTSPEVYKKLCEDHGVTYLHDSEVIIDGFKIYGSGHTPEFCNWAFNCWRTEKDKKNNDLYGYDYPFIGDFWKQIPDDTDILITHGPPYGIMDECPHHVGCEELLKRVKEIKPLVHIFGHIHESRGEERHGETKFINASSLDGGYQVLSYPPDLYEEFKI